uniref:Gap junction protein n=1 Tax=Salarias fasciatus TaxID=181472 RepID=A0A672JUE3_SALFA
QEKFCCFFSFLNLTGHLSSVAGKAWWVLMLALRSLLLLLAGFTLFSDEQQRFVCNTIQPGCSNVCFDVFAPVSVLRLWFFQLVFLSLPHFVFATYVVHKVLEVSLPRDWGLPRFYCAYFLVVILRILLEAIFTAGQFFLIGSSVPKSFFCYEAPCTSGVECYVSRPTEKTFMINFMLGVACLSILLSLVDLVGCLKAIARCRRKKELLMEEMSKGEQSSVFTAATDDTDVQLTKRMSPTGSSKMNGLRDEKPNGEKTNGGATLGERNPESNDGKADTFRSPAAASAPAPAHFVPHSHSRAPLSWRYDGGTSPNPKATTLLGVTKPDQDAPAGTNGGQTDSSECQDKRAWV